MISLVIRATTVGPTGKPYAGGVTRNAVVLLWSTPASGATELTAYIIAMKIGHGGVYKRETEVKQRILTV